MSDHSNESLFVNRKALHAYEVLDSLEVGIILFGSEIKFIKDRKAILDSSYVMIRNNEAWLVNSYIEDSSIPNHDPKRERKLLLKKKEIQDFADRSREKGLTIVPLRMYLVKRRVKLDIAVVKGLQLHDKREKMKEQDAQREIQRTVRNQDKG